jgi:phosphatidate cytidylyltransferase
MGLDKKKFATRATSAILFVLVMLGAIIYNHWSFLILFAVVQFIALKEYAYLLEKIYNTEFKVIDKFAYLIGGLCAYAFLSLIPLKECAFTYSLFQMPPLFYFLGLFLGMSIVLLVSKHRKAKMLITGIGYIALPLALLHHLRLQSLMIPLFLIFCIWINDTMAYVGGSFFGKTPLAPKISPNKTREGTAIGILFSLVFAIIWSTQFKQFELIDFMVLSLIGSALGTKGDLVESQIKRWAGVKDSGQIMPGHGGAMDRFDSIIFASSFAFLYAFFFMDCVSWEFF